MTCWGTRRRERLTRILSGVCLHLRGNCCLGDLRLRAQRLGVDQMSALSGLCAHLLDVLLDVGVLSEVSLDLSGHAGTAIKRSPGQSRVELRSHRDGRLYHTQTIPGYSL